MHPSWLKSAGPRKVRCHNRAVDFSDHKKKGCSPPSLLEFTYNLPVLGCFPPIPGCVSAPSLLGRWEPTRLSNQPYQAWLGLT